MNEHILKKHNKNLLAGTSWNHLNEYVISLSLGAPCSIRFPYFSDESEMVIPSHLLTFANFTESIDIIHAKSLFILLIIHIAGLVLPRFKNVSMTSANSGVLKYP